MTDLWIRKRFLLNIWISGELQLCRIFRRSQRSKVKLEKVLNVCKIQKERHAILDHFKPLPLSHSDFTTLRKKNFITKMATITNNSAGKLKVKSG